MGCVWSRTLGRYADRIQAEQHRGDKIQVECRGSPSRTWGTGRGRRGQNIGNECWRAGVRRGESNWLGSVEVILSRGNGGRGAGKVCAGKGGRCKKRVEFGQNIQRLNIWGLRWAGMSSGQLDEKVPVIN